MIRKNQSGFTLIELMIVIVIIATLMAILLPNMTKARYQAILVSCEQNIRSTSGGLESYSTQYGRYPTNINVIFPDFCKKVQCPSNKTDYGYEVDSEGKIYTIICNGVHYLSVNNVSQGYPRYCPSCGIVLGPAAP